MNLLIKNEALELVFNNKTIITHSIDKPFITAVKSKYYYSSSHGNFQVKEKILKRIPLINYEIEKKLDDELSIIFYKNDISIRVRTIKENDSSLRLFFETNTHGYSWEFHTVGYPNEAIFGGGEQYRQLNLRNERVKNCVSEHIVIWPIIQKTLLSSITKR